MNTGPRIAYIHSDTPNNVRVSKCLHTFSKLFSQVAYVGCWRNRPWDGAGSVPGVEYHILDQQLGRGTASLTGMPKFVRHIRSTLRTFRPDVVVTTNEDLIPLFALGILKRPKVLVCDLIDSIATRIVGPARYLQPLWTRMANWARGAVDGVVEVTEDRLHQHRSLPRHHTVIFNSPHWTNVIPQTDIPADAIYVCGSIVEQMTGVETLLAACETTSTRIVFAGRPIGQWVNDVFAQHPLVTYLGEVSPTDSLRIAAASAAVFAHYNPSIPNHIFAAPNKLYDAMLVGVPLMINSECRISKFAEKEGFGVLTPYGDVTALVSALSDLNRDRGRFASACAMAQQNFHDLYCWDKMEDRWQKFFAELGVEIAQHNQNPTEASSVIPAEHCSR